MAVIGLVLGAASAVLVVYLASRAVSGYMIGNLLISLCAGIATFAFPPAGALNVIVKELWCHRPAAPDELVVVME